MSGLKKDTAVYNAMIAALQLSGQRKLDEEMKEMKENMTGREEKWNIRENNGIKNTITSVHLFEKVQQIYSEGLADGQLQHWAYNYSIDKKGERDSSRGGRERGSVRRNFEEEGINSSIIDSIGISPIDKVQKSNLFSVVENSSIEEKKIIETLGGSGYRTVSSIMNGYVDRDSNVDVEVPTCSKTDIYGNPHVKVDISRDDNISGLKSASANDSTARTNTDTDTDPSIRQSTVTNNTVPHLIMPSVIPSSSSSSSSPSPPPPSSSTSTSSSIDSGISSTLASTSISTSAPTLRVRDGDVEKANPTGVGVGVIDDGHARAFVSATHIPPRVLDLHECPLSVAKAAIDYELREIYCEHEGGSDICLLNDDNISFQSYRDIRSGSFDRSCEKSLPSMTNLNPCTSSNKDDSFSDGTDSNNLRRYNDKKVTGISPHNTLLDMKVDKSSTTTVETERRSHRHNRRKVGVKSVGPDKYKSRNIEESKVTTVLERTFINDCGSTYSKHEMLQNNLPLTMLQMLQLPSDDNETLGDSIKGERTSPRSLCTYELHIITGRGRHLNSSGTRGVLMKEIKEYLLDNYGIKTERIQGNDGCIIVTRSSLNRWLLDMSTI